MGSVIMIREFAMIGLHVFEIGVVTFFIIKSHPRRRRRPCYKIIDGGFKEEIRYRLAVVEHRRYFFHPKHIATIFKVKHLAHRILHGIKAVLNHHTSQNVTVVGRIPDVSAGIGLFWSRVVPVEIGHHAIAFHIF